MSDDDAGYLESLAASGPIPDDAVYTLAAPPESRLERLAGAAEAAYDAMTEGDLTPLAAARAIAPYYRALEVEIQALETQREAVKRWLWDAYGQSGERALAVPEADMEITFRSPYPSVSWKRDVVEGVITALTAQNHPLATVLADAQQVKQVSGTPVIGRPKRRG